MFSTQLKSHEERAYFYFLFAKKKVAERWPNFRYSVSLLTTKVLSDSRDII